MSVSLERFMLVGWSISDTKGRRYEFPPNTVYTPNRLPGRENHPTNDLALRDFNEHSLDIHNLIKFLRLGYPQAVLNIRQLYDFGNAIYNLQEYLTLRHYSPVESHSMPPSLLDAHRAVDGVMILTGAMMNRGVGERAYASTEQMFNFASGKNPENKSLFLHDQKPDSQSCPAPESTVRRILDIMIERPNPKIHYPWCMDWEDCIDEQDIAPILEFGIAYKEFNYFIRVNREIWKEDIKVQLTHFTARLNRILGYTEEI